MSSTTSTGGGVWILSGKGASGSSGAVNIQTSNAGSAGVSGGLSFSTGVASSGSSGSIWIGTGSATDGKGGDLSLSVGSGNLATGGDITLSAGESSTFLCWNMTPPSRWFGSQTRSLRGPWASSRCEEPRDAQPAVQSPNLQQQR